MPWTPRNINLISKTAMLMEQFDRCCSAIEQRMQALGGKLQRVAQQVPTIVRQSANGSLIALPGLVMEKLGGGLDRPMHDYQQHVAVAGREVESAARALSEQIQRMERMHRLLIWKTVAAVAGCLGLLLVGGTWLSMHYARVIRESQLTAETTRAYNKADIARCGDGQLCARVDLNGKRFGDHGRYLPIKPR
jgi:hypothetical protein